MTTLEAPICINLLVPVETRKSSGESRMHVANGLC